MNTVTETAHIADTTASAGQSSAGYSAPAKALHWLHAALILSLLVLGWIMADLPQGPTKTADYALHKSLGICAFLLAAIRLAWRRTHTPPPLPASLPGWQHMASQAVHSLLYVLFFAAPIAGYLSASFTKYPMKLFGIVLPKVGSGPDEGLNHLFNGLHVAFVTLLAVTVAIHVVAAIAHAFKKDGVMDRMRPFTR